MCTTSGGGARSSRSLSDVASPCGWAVSFSLSPRDALPNDREHSRRRGPRLAQRWHRLTGRDQRSCRESRHDCEWGGPLAERHGCLRMSVEALIGGLSARRHALDPDTFKTAGWKECVRVLQCKQMRTVRKWEGSVWCVLVSMRAASGLHEEGRCVEAVPNKTAPGQRGDPSSRSRWWQPEARREG